jgi:hypothetical protein
MVAGGLAISVAASGASAASASSATDLAGVCPSTIVVQTDWNPEADHGHLYEMLGPNPTINANGKSVTGDLYADGKPTGVKLQIRAGGPAIGYSTVSAEMYQDKSITMGYVSTDEAIEFSGKLPTTAVEPHRLPGCLHDQAAGRGSSQEGRGHPLLLRRGLHVLPDRLRHPLPQGRLR